MGANARDKLEKLAAQQAAAAVAQQHIEALDKAGTEAATVEDLKVGIAILDSHGDYTASASLKMRLGRKVARQEQLAGRRND